VVPNFVLDLDIHSMSASWFDHPRDLLQMINHFRGEMPRPIIGVGHSMGGNNLVNLSLIHPRLFESLILIDPVIQTHTSPKGNVMPAQSSTVRRDVWPSRKAASESFSRSKFYQSWDPRVLKLWIKYGLRDLPTKLHPEKQRASIPAGPITPEATLGPVAKDKEITLTTTKHQEVASFLRPYLGAEFPAGLSEEQLAHLSKLTYPDLPNNWDMSTKVYRPEPMITFNNLPHLRPSVLYIFGELSPMSNADFRVQKMAVTGIGVSGSGGAKEGRVKEELIMGVGHLIPMENVGETSRLASEWIGSELIRWRKGEELVANQWKQIPEDEKYTLGKRFTALMHNDLGAGRSQKPGAPKL
jgi:pimeloyl-ACP methyl ester carboxylesterase